MRISDWSSDVCSSDLLVGVAKCRTLPATKGMVSDWNRDRHVDADHADIYTCLEFTGGVAVTGENGDAVSILMLAGKRQRLLKIEIGRASWRERVCKSV